MTGIYFDGVTGDWAISVEAASGVCGYAATTQEAAARLSEELARWERYHLAQADAPAAQHATDATPRATEATPAALSVPLPAEPVTVTERHNARRPRCCYYKAIRRAFAIARGQGLDTRDDEAMRAAFGRCLGRSLGSRDELSGGDWMLLGDAMKMRRLCW